MNKIIYLKKVFADENPRYLTSLPNNVIEALKQRKRLPEKLYVHWMLFSKNENYYRVTLGDARAKNKSPLTENTTELPTEIEEHIQLQEKNTHLEATAILWKITKWNGQTVALAKILFGYGKKIEETIESFAEKITITPEIKYYMNLHGRTQLYWKHIAKNTWLVSKDRKDYDAVTWNAWDKIKLPHAVRKELGFFINATVKIEFSTKNDKPALVLRIKRNTTYLYDFLNDTLEENGKGIEIHELYNKYLEYLKAIHKKPSENEYYFFVSTLEDFHIISVKTWIKLTNNEQMPYVIPNYGLKAQTNKGGGGNE